MFKAHEHAGWSDWNLLIYVPVCVLLAFGWWRLMRQSHDPLLLAVPFYVLLHVAHSIDVGARFFVPLIPIFMASVACLVHAMRRGRALTMSGLLAAHFAVCVTYSLAIDAPRGRAFASHWKEAVCPMIIINYPSVRRELALTSDQTERVEHLWADYRMAYRDEMVKVRDSDEPRLVGQARIKQIRAIEAKVEVAFRPKIAEVLDAKQQARLAQIAIQCASFHALQDAEVVKSLGLTKDQQGKIAAIVDEKGPKEGGSAMREFRRQQLEKVVAVLTKDQQQEFDKLRGKRLPFEIQ